MRLSILVLLSAVDETLGFTSSQSWNDRGIGKLQMSSSAGGAGGSATSVVSWEDLTQQIGQTAVGKALNEDAEQRLKGRGSPNVHNKMRLFDSKFSESKKPAITLFRDHAGWCPYCEKTMLLVEEKQVPLQIDLVPMRSYGDKPREFLRKVPNGLLPAIEVQGQVITESSVIMELLDRWHPTEDGYRPMMPDENDVSGQKKYTELARLERELFSWWCTLMFRPELPAVGGNMIKNLFGGGGEAMSGSMQGFMDCMKKVDSALADTEGPWFFGKEYPTMIDFVFASHIERMLASCAFWKGLDLRDSKWGMDSLIRWLDAFDRKPYFLAFKGDYYSTVLNIEPQYGPAYDGGFDKDRIQFSKTVLGKDDSSWRLPMPHDDPLQPLYKGLPLPVCVLNAVDIEYDENESFESTAKDNAESLHVASRHMAVWKVSSNGNNISKFAARGGPQGSKNPRKSFGADLADPYAESDTSVQGSVDAVLRVVCQAMMDTEKDKNVVPSAEYEQLLLSVVGASGTSPATIVPCLEYLRDRVGVPRDLPLASARYFRAYLNWGIDVLSK